MSKFVTSVVLITLLCLAFFGLVSSSPSPTSRVSAKTLEAATSQAGVSATEGKVEKLTPSGSSWSVCQVGDILRAGDRIRTGKDGSASLLLADQSALRLGHGTEMLIVDLVEQENGNLIRRFQVKLGRVFSDVTPSSGGKSVFEVQGPNAVAAVRGTAFEVDARANDEEPTDVRVWDGEVECRADDVVERVKAQGEFNHFRAPRKGRGKHQRLRFGAADADDWQHENLETRAAWRRVTPKLPRRLRLNPETLQNYNRVRRQLTPQQRQKFRQRLQRRELERRELEQRDLEQRPERRNRPPQKPRRYPNRESR